MWRSGVLFILSVLIAVTSAGFHYGAPLQRLKRSPGYSQDCPPYYPEYHHHHRHWPPYGPPPPPFGPPPFGPPPFGPPPPPPPPPNWQQADNYQEQNFATGDKSQALMEQKSTSDFTNGQQPVESVPPCTKCGKTQSSAVSNAQSGTGSAIAIAISGKNK